jgi:hypothetical protein
MPRILIELPKDRKYTGLLTVLDDTGGRLLGPFRVGGRASDAPAKAHGNPNRVTTLPYGDTPLGVYRLRQVLETGEAAGYDIRQYGPCGLVVLDAVSGDAALAEAAGRFHVFIQSGDLGIDKRLRVTNGCLRMANKDLEKLVAAVRSHTGMLCECIESWAAADAQLVAMDDAYDEGDPPPLASASRGPVVLRQRSVSRREFIHTATATFAGFAFGGINFVSSPQAAMADSDPYAVAPSYNQPLPSGDNAPKIPPSDAGQAAVGLYEDAIQAAQSNQKACNKALVAGLNSMGVDTSGLVDDNDNAVLANKQIEYISKSPDQYQQIGSYSATAPVFDPNDPKSVSQAQSLNAQIVSAGQIAQQYANRGEIVIAVSVSSTSTGDGHVAFVVPQWNVNNSKVGNHPDTYPTIAGGSSGSVFSKGDLTANNVFTMPCTANQRTVNPKFQGPTVRYYVVKRQN